MGVGQGGQCPPQSLEWGGGNGFPGMVLTPAYELSTLFI